MKTRITIEHLPANPAKDYGPSIQRTRVMFELLKPAVVPLVLSEAGARTRLNGIPGWINKDRPGWHPLDGKVDWVKAVNEDGQPCPGAKSHVWEFQTTTPWND